MGKKQTVIGIFKRYTKKRRPGRPKQQTARTDSMAVNDEVGQIWNKKWHAIYYFIMSPKGYIHNYDTSMFE